MDELNGIESAGADPESRIQEIGEPGEEKLVLRTSELVKKYGQRTVVNHVSINVTQGEIVGLLGPNGAGKTTTFYMTVGLISPNEGEIFLGDQNITKYPVYKRAHLGIGYLAQEASVFRKMTVEDNIRSVLEMTGTSKAYQKEKLEQLLEEFNLAGVDPIAVEDIQSVVYRLKEKNIGILITDHNANETLNITDRAYLLFDGKILFQGTSEELAENPIVRQKYLGEKFMFNRKKFSN